MTHKEAVIEAMSKLAQLPRAIFVGQTVRYPGSYMYGSLEKVSMEQRIELPVAEELQMGMSMGLAMEGFCVVSIFPRMDFLLLAMNQLVNHLDKLSIMSKIPPKPGSNFPESLTPQSRLIRDSDRSPNWPKPPKNAPIKATCHSGKCTLDGKND